MEFKIPEDARGPEATRMVLFEALAHAFAPGDPTAGREWLATSGDGSRVLNEVLAWLDRMYVPTTELRELVRRWRLDAKDKQSAVDLHTVIEVGTVNRLTLDVMEVLERDV